MWVNCDFKSVYIRCASAPSFFLPSLIEMSANVTFTWLCVEKQGIYLAVQMASPINWSLQAFTHPNRILLGEERFSHTSLHVAAHGFNQALAVLDGSLPFSDMLIRAGSTQALRCC